MKVVVGSSHRRFGSGAGPRGLGVIALGTITTLALFGATVWVADLRQIPDRPVAAAAAIKSAIDRVAVDRIAPPDAVVNVKTAFGAVGDGRTDDTAAIQRAMSAGVGLSRRNVLFFPTGTYLVTKSLEWRDAGGSWQSSLTLMGQNRDRTIIRLADRAAGFADPALPRGIIVTGSQNSDGSGSGNQAFNNFVFDLTVDVGQGNPGADGIDYLVNNRGAIRNVILRAPTGSGHFGISMTRRWPGPGLLKDVRIEGFDIGVGIGQTQYSMTIEDLRLTGQRTAGIRNQTNVLAVRRLMSTNRVPAVVNLGGPPGLVTLLDSELTGGSRDAPAIDNDGGIYLRAVRTAGYAATVRDRGVNRSVSSRAEWFSGQAATLFGGRTESLKLTIRDAPELPSVPLSSYASVDQAGANPTDNNDDTQAVQNALNSGKPVVYFRAGRYVVSRTLTVPSSVKAIRGFEGQIDARTGVFAGSSTAAVFMVSGSSTTPVIFSQMHFWNSPTVVSVERPGSRPVALTDVHIHGLGFRGGAGRIFLTDVEGGSGWRFTRGQEIWARQFNAEQKTQPKISNVGAKLWILGLKTEAPGTVIASQQNAQTELLGGLLYPVLPVTDRSPAFSSVDSVDSFVFVTNSGAPSNDYQVLVDATRAGRSEQLLPTGALRRGGGTLTSLFSDKK